jgi:hypothetical protein
MTKLRLIGAAVLALAIAGPATARVYVRNSELPTAGYYHGTGGHFMRAPSSRIVS